jgi:uncharacterized iron-regulated protein
MTTQELIDALDQRYGNPNAKGLELIQEAICVLRQQQAEIEALKAELRLIDELVTGKAQEK